MHFHDWEIYFSFLFYFGAKSFCCFYKMFRQDLSSIPERNESEETQIKWVPKKKHEVLKAKYKCLKKLFQIYDASFMAVAPEPIEYSDDTTKRRLKRSHRTKTDACAGTTESVYSDISQEECKSIATESEDLKRKQSCATQMESNFENTSIKSDTVRSSNSEVTTDFEKCNGKCARMNIMNQNMMPCLMVNDRRKLTRFQTFVQRIFGIRQTACNFPFDAYAASDSCHDRRRRRGMRFRRLRRAKKVKSESDIKDMQSSAILSYVQSAQRNCLLDTTPRQCPIVGCKMMSYGIINYNDHLNLSHFKDRKFICQYCHEGFEKDCDKLIHENGHIGLNKISTNLSRQKVASNCITQTDREQIPDEKLKKIVSFFDKISDPDELITEIRKNRSSETNLAKNLSTSDSQNSSDKRTMSCMNIGKCKCESSSAVTSQQYGTTVSGRIGDKLQYRRYLSLHSKLEHSSRKFSKFHSCDGIPRRGIVSEDGRLNVRSIDSASVTETAYSVTPSQSDLKLNRDKSDVSLTCDPSTNIVYSSLESLKKLSNDSLAQKVRKYKWEPGTKVIHV